MTRLRLFRRKRVIAIQPGRQVRTNYGVVEGARLIDDGDCQIDAFMGIPFAKPPVGPLRFKKPEPPEPWEGVRKTVKFGPRAPQKDFLWTRWTAPVKRNEDCLYLNVFSPARVPSENQQNGFAVMVFVHGGAFLMDSASKYGDINICNNLCRNDVVVVTIQYRLGLLGFFCTGDEACPGNNGLWDQTMALQWVKENISAFNGDPERITLFGQSAGGASVDLLSLSPKSRDLFQQVIPMAGNAECNWAVTDQERIVDACRRFAEKVGWTNDEKDGENHEKMLDYLRTLSAKVFERGMFGRDGVNTNRVGLDLAPVIDGDFLPKSIAELRMEAPIKNCMVGTCEHEGLIFATMSPNPFTLRGIDKLLTTYIPAEKYANFNELREETKKYYLDGVNIRNKLAVARAYEELYSNLFVTNGTTEYAEKMTALGHNVYLYSFDHFNPKSFGILSLRVPFKGATHCTEIAYIFGVSIIFPFKYTKIDKQVKDVTTRLWTNFAKFGDPNGEGSDPTFGNINWLPVVKNKPARYLSIGTLTYQMKEEYGNRRAEFWRNLRKNDMTILKSSIPNSKCG